MGKRPGAPRDPLNDPLARVSNVVVTPLSYLFPEGLECHYCIVREATTRDHIVPRAKGGTDAWWNLVPSCVPCNRAKSDRMPDCACAYCQRAIFLWEKGYTRTSSRHHSLFSIRAKALPYDLSHGAYLKTHPREDST